MEPNILRKEWQEIKHQIMKDLYCHEFYFYLISDMALLKGFKIGRNDQIVYYKIFLMELWKIEQKKLRLGTEKNIYYIVALLHARNAET